MRGYYLRFKGYPAGKIQWDERELQIKLRHPEKGELQAIYLDFIHYLKEELNYQLVPATEGIGKGITSAELYHAKTDQKKKRKNHDRRNKM